MKRWLILGCTFFLIGLGFITCSSKVEAIEQVTITFHTKGEDGKSPAGVEKVAFELYDLTDWRMKEGKDEKAAKELIMNSYKTKDKVENFITTERLPKLTPEAMLVNQTGSVEMQVDRYRNNSDAAYLIVASGETGEDHLLPFVIYLPQYLTGSKDEAEVIEAYAKYLKIPAKEEPEEPEEPIVPSQPGGGSPSGNTPGSGSIVNTSTGRLPATGGGSIDTIGSTRKLLPQTNDKVNQYLIIGLVLVCVAGFLKQRSREEG